jgi:glycosyltransferase involved in cell wall biosynthesis
MSVPAALLINSLGTGGAERALAAAASELRRRGRDVRIVCLESTPTDAALTVSFPVVQLSAMSPTAGGPRKLIALPLLSFRLARYVAQERVKVVMSHLFRANFVNILSRLIAFSHHAAIVVNHTRVSRLSSEGMQGRINTLLCRWLYPKADLVASVSKGAAAECARLLGLPSDQTVILHDPIATAASSAALPGSVAGGDARDSRTIVCVGRLVALKRFQDLIMAFARVARDDPRLRLRIAGDGPERTALQQLSEKLEIQERVTFLGMVSEPSHSLAGCACFVSSSETEGFGMAIVEALALGVPVIASDCAYGPREILSPASDPLRLLEPEADFEKAPYGILYPVGSIDALEKALRKVLGDSDLRAEFSRKGTSRAADFSVERAADAYQRLLYPA